MQPGQGGYDEIAPEVSSSVAIFFELLKHFYVAEHRFRGERSCSTIKVSLIFD